MKPLSDREFRALVGLLEDEDPASQEVLRRQILDIGRAVLPFLDEARATKDPGTLKRIASLRRQVLHRELGAEFSVLASAEEPDLERGCILIARHSRPDADAAAASGWLDRTAAQASGRVEPGGDPYPVFLRLAGHMFGSLGFHGSKDMRSDLDAHRLDLVIERRSGSPAALSALFILLGRRLGLTAGGAGLPGYFLVRLPLGGRAFYLDAYRGGLVLTRMQAREFLVKSGQVYREEMLGPASDRELLARLLGSLISIHRGDGESEDAAELSDLLDLLIRGQLPPEVLFR